MLTSGRPDLERLRNPEDPARIRERCSRANMICKERLDRLMKKFKSIQPDFYNASYAARDIINTGHRKKKPLATP